MAVENATLQGSRAGALGCLRPDGTRAGQASEGQILDAAHRAGGGLLKRESLRLTTSVFSSLANAGAGIGGVQGAAGTAGQTVSYTLTYDQPLILVGAAIGRTTYTHTGTITIKNEPFANGGANAQPCT